jgi:hypothetical protein
MKRSTTGLKVRFFNVTIAHGHGGIGVRGMFGLRSPKSQSN